MRIAHVSDLHLQRWTSQLDALRTVLGNLAMDLLVVTGDFCQWPDDTANCAALCTALFENVAPPLGAYGVLGNHDSAALATQPIPVRLLRNESITLPTTADADHPLVLAGIEQHIARRGTVRETLPEFDRDAAHIILAHYPSTAYELPAGQGVLMLSGHTHGGQIRIPGIGCLFTNDDIPRSMSRGLHTVRGNWLHVSAGVGASWPLQIRVCCPPEITLMTLRAPHRRTGHPHRQRARRRVKTTLAGV